MQPSWGLCMCFGLLLLFPASSWAQPDNRDDANRSDLYPRASRRLKQAEGAAQHPCADLKAGAPIPGRFVLMFKEQIQTFDEGVASLQAALSDGQVSAASAPSAPLPVDITKQFQGSATPQSSGGRRRRRRLQQGAAAAADALPVGFAFTGTAETAKVLGAVDTVQYVAPDQCVKLMTTQMADDEIIVSAAAAPSTTGYSCLPAAQVSGITVKPADGASWPGCLATSGVKLAWWGERCGPSNLQIEWTGVYAYNAQTGERVPGCIKVRPATGAPPDDIKTWLGTGCGAVPAVLPAMPPWVCSNDFPDSTCQSSSATPGTCPTTYCIRSGNPLEQTVEIMHPSDSCSPRKPVKMRFVGERCYGDAAVGSVLPSIRWLSATPAEDVSNPDACLMSRKVGASADAVVYNQNYFGSCGVPPARIQYLPWGECAVIPPPPPPPPAPPPPRNMGPLPRERVGTAAQTVPTGVRRIQAVVAQADGSLQTVRQLYESRVATMDTGIQCDHPDLNVSLAKSFVDEPSNIPGRNPGCFDGYGHGTHVAGTIGALNNGIGVLGVLPNTPIVSLKVLDRDGNGAVSDIMTAVYWLMATSDNGTDPNPGGATNAEYYSINVLSMSLGFTSKNVNGGTGGTLCKALQRLADEGVVSVAAASNDQLPLNNVAPANCPAVVAVTSINQEDGQVSAQQQNSWFSNYLNLNTDDTAFVPATPEKKKRTIAGPGTRINSTCSWYSDENNNGYCVLSGTSQATPHVAAIYARCFSSGACRVDRGAANIDIPIQQFVTYNTQINTDYGYQQDPIRSPNTACNTTATQCKYYGYLSWADASWVD